MLFSFLRVFHRGLFFFSVLIILPLCGWAQEPIFNLAAFVGIPTGQGAQSKVVDIAVDATGNTYVTGEFLGTMRFGNTTLNGSGRLGPTMFIAKLDATGNCRWAVQSDGDGESGNAIALDGSGNVYVAGYFLGPTVRVGNFTLANSTPTGRNLDQEVLVAKLDGNGNWLWAQKAGGVGPDRGRGIAVDSGGNAYITGDYSSTASFGGTMLPNATAAAAFPNGSDVFIARLDPQGAWQWALRGGSGGGCLGSSIALDGRGDVYVAGYSQAATARLGPFVLPSPGCFTAKLATMGAWQWVTPGNAILNPFYIGTQDYAGPQVAVDAAGSACISGAFLGQATFGPYTFTSTGRYRDAYVARLDANGIYQWAVRAGGAEYATANDVVLDSHGNCRVVGYFDGLLNGSGQPTRFGQFTTTASRGVFTALLDEAGTWQWVAQANGNGFGRCLASGPGLTTYIGGTNIAGIGMAHSTPQNFWPCLPPRWQILFPASERRF